MRSVKEKIEAEDSERLEYGRVELKKSYRKNYIRGQVLAVALFAVTFGAYYGAEYLGDDDDDIPTVAMRIIKYSDLGPPPSISAAPPPPSVGITTSVKPTVGVPVPVPDAEINPEQTLATQAELSAMPSPAIEQSGEGDGSMQIQQDITIAPEDEPAMDAFIPVEKEPQVVKRVVPKYPEMAIRAGLEGTVWVKILVDRDGRPKKAVVVKSSAEMFNEEATKAAMAFIFTPAVMNNGPVKVWVSIPFRFQLKDTSPS